MDWIERLNRDVTGRVPLLLGGGICPVEVLQWAYSPALQDNVPHRHTFFEVCLVGSYGSGVFRVGNEDRPISPGELFIARPGVLHQIRNTSSPLMELSWVSFTLAPVASKSVPVLQSFLSSAQVVVSERVHTLTPSWNLSLRAMAENSEASILSVTALATALLTAILHSGTGGIL